MIRKLFLLFLFLALLMGSALGDAVPVTLSDETGSVTIGESGEYLVSGSLTDGQLRVDAGDGKVTLRLDGAQIACSWDAALRIDSADKVILEPVPGTVSSLTGGGSDEEEGAALYSRADLTIRGEGGLTVTGTAHNGIQTTKDLKLHGSDITVTAAGHGIRGKGSVTVNGGRLRIRAGGDGICSASTQEGKGQIWLKDGELSVTADGDGISAATDLTVSGGTIEILSGGGHGNAASHTSGGWGSGRHHGWDMDWDTDWDPYEGTETESAETVSAKGLKAGAALTVEAGSVTIDSADDAIHAAGEILIGGGQLTLSTGDDGVHSDTKLTVSGGELTVTASYEGLEAHDILISGGTSEVTAEDDGLNACGGTDGWSWGRGWDGYEEEEPQTEETIPTLTITGGTLHVDAEGDGLDSNGDLTVRGGLVTVDGPTYPMNGALDAGTESGGTCAVHGGTVLAIGAAGMAESFDSGSTQCSVSAEIPFSAGDTIEILDADGRTLFSHTALKSGESVIFSDPALTEGGSYTVRVGGEEEETVTAGYGGKDMDWSWWW